MSFRAHRRRRRSIQAAVARRNPHPVQTGRDPWDGLERRLLMSAFSGAVGFGANATGGGSSPVYYVTNLNDSGAGSFRDAVSESNRVVEFKVGGYITLSSAVSVASDITIWGETAPGQGIGIKGAEVSFSNATNVIVRYMRFREGTEDPDTGKSAVAMDGASDIILDHCSIQFGQWDDIDMNDASDVTIQRCIISDPIGQQFGDHDGSQNVTFAYDVWANLHNRAPLAKGNTQFIDNVVYNYQAAFTSGDSGGADLDDVVNNYFIAGPATTNANDAFYQLDSNDSVYASGNYVDGNKDGTLNGSLTAPGGVTKLASPWASTTNAIASYSAADAVYYVVNNVGDNYQYQDTVDALDISQVKSLGKSGPGGGLYKDQASDGLANDGYGNLETVNDAAVKATAVKATAVKATSVKAAAVKVKTAHKATAKPAAAHA
jgi:hypothetical protein